jgi:ectoine hydroxylase-related dioxygenase (phytanoyl-CoA dioxygenase family)
MPTLTEAEIELYREDGYCVPDVRLPESLLADIREAHDRLVSRHPEYRDYCPNILAYDLSFLNIAREPIIMDRVADVLGPDIALWNSSFFAKPAMNGRKTPWHQDGEYWPIRPLATCTAWIAIDDATIENGCLRIIKGSHKAKRLAKHTTNPAKDLTLNQELVADEFDEAQAVDLVLEAGQFSLHDVFLYHGSEANASPNPRRGMTLRYMPTTSVFDREMAKRLTAEKGITDHSDRTTFLMRGSDQTGENDFRLRW